MYANDDPVNEVDPSGTTTVPLTTCIANVVGIIISDLFLGGAAVATLLVAARSAGFLSGAAVAEFIASFLPPFVAKFIPVLGYIALALAVIKVTADVVSYTSSNC